MCSSSSGLCQQRAVRKKTPEDMEEERNNKRHEEHREALVGQRRGGRHGSGRSEGVDFQHSRGPTSHSLGFKMNLILPFNHTLVSQGHRPLQ